MSDSGQCREMTVAHIRDKIEADHVDVVFLESARFYRLHRANPDFAQALKRLQEAMKKGSVVIVELDSPQSEIIRAIRTRQSET